MGMMWRYEFQTLNDGSYYCYFGCSQFKKKGDLVRHLLEVHNDELYLWGISAFRLSKRIASDPKLSTKSSPSKSASISSHTEPHNEEVVEFSRDKNL